MSTPAPGRVHRGLALLVAVACSTTLSACDAGSDVDAAPAEPAHVASQPAAPPAAAAPVQAPRATATLPAEPDPGGGASARPDWLGSRILPRAPDGFGVRLPTPPELVDRRLPPAPLPAPAPAGPPADGSFRSTIEPVPAAVAARSTWRPECPVGLEELRYVTVTFVGFDDRDHTGELLLHHDVAEDVARAFEALHAARFPLEELRVIAAHELDLPPTGDGNVSSAFVCRPSVGSTSWSQHAFGRAVDINPFHNPYVRGDLVLPELAGAYVDRDVLRPGMVLPDGPVTAAFAAIGWGWGGDWTSAADWMHFSATGR